VDAEAGGERVMLDPYAHEIAVQRSMVRDMNLLPDGGRLGALHPCGRDPATGEPLTLGMMFDRYSLALLVVQEVEARAAAGAA